MPFVNEARWDRALRVLVGSGMLLVGWLVLPDGLLAAACKVFGWIPLVTGVLGWSPLYSILGFSTHAGRYSGKGPGASA